MVYMSTSTTEELRDKCEELDDKNYELQTKIEALKKENEGFNKQVDHNYFGIDLAKGKDRTGEIWIKNGKMISPERKIEIEKCNFKFETIEKDGE